MAGRSDAEAIRAAEAGGDGDLYLESPQFEGFDLLKQVR